MISTGHNFPFAVKLGPMVSAILFTYTLIILVGKMTLITWFHLYESVRATSPSLSWFEGVQNTSIFSAKIIANLLYSHKNKSRL